MSNLHQEIESAEISEIGQDVKSNRYELIEEGGLTYSRELREYMGLRYTIYDYATALKLRIERKTDVEYLSEALDPANLIGREKLRELFAATRTYRLRFDEHFQAGKDFVLKAASENVSFFPKEALPECKNRFLDLCKAATNPAEKYRLFELNATRGDVKVKLVHVLSFLFGIGKAGSTQATSLNHFIARFQFFEKFLLYGYKVHAENRFKEMSKASCDWLFSFAEELWRVSIAEASELVTGSAMSLKNNLYRALEDDRRYKLDSVDTRFVPMLKHYYSRRDVGFNNSYNSVVHFMRHIDEVYRFYEFKKEDRDDWIKGLLPQESELFEGDAPEAAKERTTSVKFLVKDYGTMIREILLKPIKLSYQPQQFGGHKLTFIANKQEREFRVIATVYPNRTSFILTCY